MSVTMKDVAELAGVNDSTVSRALRDDLRVNATTRQRIKMIAAQMGYRPDSHARRLATKAVEEIGVVVATEVPRPLIHSVFALDWIDMLEEEMKRRDLTCQLVTGAILAPLDGAEVVLPKMLSEKYLDGVLVANHMTAALAKALREAHVLFVAINAVRIEGVPTINVAEDKTTEVLVRHLSALGHRRIAFANGDHDNGFRSRLRATGYVRGMADAGLPLFRGWDALRQFDETFEDLFERDDPPTAVIAYDDIQAYYFEREMMRRGLLVPRDISLASAHVWEHLPVGGTALTRMRRPNTEMTHLAIQALLAIMHGRPQDARSMTLDPELEVKETTGAPRTDGGGGGGARNDVKSQARTG